MHRLLIMLVLLTDIVFAATVYSVELSSNDNLSAYIVSQTFVATVDSIGEVAFFCGRKITRGRYQFCIADSTGKYITKWIYSDSAGLYGYEFVAANFLPKVYVKKGFNYRFVVKHNQDSLVNFYYNRRDSYKGGRLIGQSNSFDLAARITGKNDLVDIFGCNSNMTIVHADRQGSPFDDQPWDKAYWKQCVDSMAAIGISWDRAGYSAWQLFQYDSDDKGILDHNWCDDLMSYYAKHSISVLWNFSQSTRWATSAKRDAQNRWYDGLPVKLFEPVMVGNKINPNNYFAQYVYEFVKRYGPGGTYWKSNPGLPYKPVRYFEMWNEPEYALKDVGPGTYWSKDSLNDLLYKSFVDSLGKARSLAKVYARLCVVGDSAARKAAGDSVIYTLAYVPFRPWDSDETVETGKWLDWLYRYGVHDHCDGMSYHGYASGDGHDHRLQKYYLDNIWDSLRVHYFGDKFLWNTEWATGWVPKGGDTLSGFKRNAELQLTTFITLLTNQKPRGPLEHSYLWCFSYRYFPDTLWEEWYSAVTGPNYNRRPMAYSYAQMVSHLRDCVFNRSLVDGATSDTICVYEFENQQTGRRTYVAWKERGVSGAPRPFNVPLRTNSAKIERVAYNRNPDAKSLSAKSNGWFTVNIDTVPVYVSEPTNSALQRPDLIIDSIWTDPSRPKSGQLIRIYALLRNIDLVTPSPGPVDLNFYVNDSLVSNVRLASTVKAQGTRVATSKYITLHSAGAYMCRVVVNQERSFAESEFENNSRHDLIKGR